MRILLAPMEGVVDHSMRDFLSAAGGIDRCVTEFVRVTRQLLPDRVFHRYCPELSQGGMTPAGVPVYLQLLGGDPQLMAENSAAAARLGAAGIDLNFGCPAKTVNRHDGGSVLLQEPDRVHRIVAAVRNAVPAAVPVTAKIRLGYADHSQFGDICRGVIEAGATELTVHARTRQDGYKPPAHWELLADLASYSPIPVIANGEIWTVQDALRCQQQSGCQAIMLGRGILARPDLAQQIRAHNQQQPVPVWDWPELLVLLERFLDLTETHFEPRHVGNRIKQWLGYLRFGYLQAGLLFEEIRRLTCPEQIRQTVHRHRRLAESPISEPLSAPDAHLPHPAR